ncbi:fused MFS/spermidine synthase [Aliivibrio fischeri]|uniref:fused MFS/spermidine synthase n=1 Tax=Aliivibrio fischeri TaxID=668 RepID=UPI0007C50BC5|nr:fused MFS/spermidine synthase [Aliivibrio fischeri]
MSVLSGKLGAVAGGWSHRVGLNSIKTIYFLTFLSGFVSLGYQYFWFKSLSVTVGVDLYSSSVVIGGFFLGLGLGMLFFAKARNYERYYLLELYVTILAMVCSLVSQSLWLYLGAVEVLGWGALIFTGLMFSLPAFFMGATLLALIRLSLKLNDKSSESVIYGVNVLGAMLGTFLSAAVLLPALGVSNSLFLLYSLNLLLVAIGFALENEVRTKGGEQKKAAICILRTPKYELIFLYALSGFLSLSCEISWLQLLNQVLPSRSINYSIILTVMLGGLALGSLIFSRLKISQKMAYHCVFGVSASSIIIPLFLIYFLNPSSDYNYTGLVSNFITNNSDRLNDVFSSYWLSRAREILNTVPIVLFIVFIPSVLFGAIFPLVVKASNRENEEAAFNSGLLLGFNTIAGVLATLITGFVLIPYFGVIGALKLIMWFGVVSIVLLLLFLSKSKMYSVGFAVVTMLLVSLIQVILPWDKTNLLLVDKFKDIGSTSIFFSEGKGYSISVLEEPVGTISYKRLFVRGESNTADSMPSLRYMRLQSYIPYFAHNSEPKNALVIGLGTGITSGSFSQVDSIKHVDVFELLPDMVEATKLFSESNYDVVNQDKVTIHIGDGRMQLAKTHKLYDIITLEPPPPSSSGVNSLYSDDFYKLAKAKMAQNAVLAQWFPLGTQSAFASRAILHTMMNNFKFVNVWYTERFEALIVGSDTPFNGINYSSIESKWNSNPKIADSLLEVGIEQPVELLATYLGGGDDFHEYIKGASLITDDNALLEVDQYASDWSDINVTYDSLIKVFEQVEWLNVPGNKVQTLFEHKELQRMMLYRSFDKNDYLHLKGNAYIDWLIEAKWLL